MFLFVFLSLMIYLTYRIWLVKYMAITFQMVFETQPYQLVEKLCMPSSYCFIILSDSYIISLLIWWDCWLVTWIMCWNILVSNIPNFYWTNQCFLAYILSCLCLYLCWYYVIYLWNQIAIHCFWPTLNCDYWAIMPSNPVIKNLDILGTGMYHSRMWFHLASQNPWILHLNLSSPLLVIDPSGSANCQCCRYRRGLPGWHSMSVLPPVDTQGSASFPLFLLIISINIVDTVWASFLQLVLRQWSLSFSTFNSFDTEQRGQLNE